MNRIIKSHLQSFQAANGLEDLDPQSSFEHFVNYCVGYRHTGAPFDTQAVTTDDPDAGIDGVICLVDNEIVMTADECEEIFKRSKRNVDAKIIFTQATTAEGFEKAKLTTFNSGVYDFLQDEPAQPHGSVLKEYHELFDVIVKNANKVINGKPECELCYAATGRFNQEVEIVAASKAGQHQLGTLNLFSKVSVQFLDADALLRLWLECSQTIKASVDVVGSIPLAKTEKVPEAYLALVGAKAFVEKLLLNEEGDLRVWVFNENVRAFLGEDSQVNADIQKTIKSIDARARFALLNNGVTIVSPDIRVQGGTINLNGFQIVNGCQTSNVLFANRKILSDDTTIAVKFIEAEDPDVVAEIVRATNKQAKVEDEQFFALEPLVKRIEEFFKSYTQDEQKVYLERRFRQYVGAGVPQLRIFDIKNACRAVSAMFFNRPDLAMRYPNQMFDELKDQLFDEKIKEIVYYTACLGLYRVSLMISSGKLPSNFRRLKWHLLLASRVAVAGKKLPNLASGGIAKYCESLIKVYSNPNPMAVSGFAHAVEYIKSISDEHRNKLTTKMFVINMQEEVSKKEEAAKKKE
ncbi:AIPR family protein [Archangium sp.]|uniref:AIPR family protein n=1 Tax=Archangium sp. TaxID=1872627 RepID=UPI00286C0D28|nr:AIPR family protein [Archangium sp.]